MLWHFRLTLSKLKVNVVRRFCHFYFCKSDDPFFQIKMLDYVKLWLYGDGIVRSGKSKTEFMICPFGYIRNSRENKNRQPIRAAVFSPPAEILFGEFPHHTSSGTFVPDQGHLSSPLPGCQTRLRVVPDVGSDHNKLAARGKKILCHRKQRDPSVSRYKPSFRHSPRARAWNGASSTGTFTSSWSISSVQPTVPSLAAKASFFQPL
jgi:hypothetical protein